MLQKHTCTNQQEYIDVHVHVIRKGRELLNVLHVHVHTQYNTSSASNVTSHLAHAQLIQGAKHSIFKNCEE